MLTRNAGAGYLSSIETSQPESEPITLAEFKAHARITSATEDGDIVIKLLASRLRVEDLIGSPLITRSFRLRLDAFPAGLAAIVLPQAPITSITSVEYLLAGVWTVLSAALYELDSDTSPARILCAYGVTSWASCDAGAVGVAAVRVTYVAGYASAAVVPCSLKMAVLMLASYYFANRETADILNLKEVPHAVDSLCAAYKRTRWLI